MKNRAYFTTAFLLLSAMLITLDAGTKQLAVRELGGGREIVLLPRVLTLLYLENRGAAFGILRGQQWIFYIITIFVAALLLYLIFRIPMRKRYFPLFLVCLLVFSGAIGNFVDRVSQHYVVDFIYFKLIDFPIFNVADIYVTVGCFLMVLLFLFYYRDEDFTFLRRKR